MTIRLKWRSALTVAFGLVFEGVQCLGAQAISRGAGTVLARLKSGNVVELVDPVTSAGRRIYQAFAWSSTGLTVSPTGAHLGLLEVHAGILDGVNYRVPPRADLIVLDTSGRIVRRIAQGVANYTWCGADCLVYIRGTYQETDLSYATTGAFVLNLTTGTLDSVAGPSPNYLMWAPFDSSVYFKYPGRPIGQLIQRYHLPTRTLERTSHHDFGFSPDGRYYLHLGDASDPRVRVYNTQLDQEIPIPSGWIPERWLPSGGSLLVLGKTATRPALRQGELPLATPRRAGGSPDLDYSVYDTGTRRVVSSLQGHFAPWASPHGSVPFVSKGRINVITYP